MEILVEAPLFLEYKNNSIINMLVSGQKIGKCISYTSGHVGCLSMPQIGGALSFQRC